MSSLYVSIFVFNNNQLCYHIALKECLGGDYNSYSCILRGKTKIIDPRSGIACQNYCTLGFNCCTVLLAIFYYCCTPEEASLLCNNLDPQWKSLPLINIVSWGM